MKRYITYIIFSLLFLASLYGQNKRTIDVSGEAVITVIPDNVVIRFGIEIRDMDLMKAKQQYNKIDHNAVSAVKDLGVREKDIQLDYLNITPMWSNYQDKNIFLGYQIKNSMVVTLEDVTLIEDVVTEVIRAGVNRVDGIDFVNDDIKKYRDEARALAIKAAKEKAEKSAELLGQKLGDPIRVSFYSSGSPTRFNSTSALLSNTIVNTEATNSELSEITGLGKISIKASVSITFEFANQADGNRESDKKD